MHSPLRSEAEAFRFVVVVAVAAAAVALAGVLAPTPVSITVSILVSVAVAAVYLDGGRAPRIPAAPAHVGPASERRTLLLVEEEPPEESLAAVPERADRVLVVAVPASSPLRHWVSDVDTARARARRRMEDAVGKLRALRVDATGVVGDDGDPFASIDDALRTFGGDEILVAGGDARLVERLHARYALPVGRAGTA